MKIILFNPQTLELISTESKKNIDKKVQQGFLIIGKVEGWNTSVKPLQNNEFLHYKDSLEYYAKQKQTEQYGTDRNKEI